MTYKPLHCWDCGTKVIDGVDGSYTLRPDFRQIRFGLSDGSYCESPFCTPCAERPWPIERVKQFELAVNAIDPRHQITVIRAEGVTLPRVTVLEPIHVAVANITTLPTAPSG